MEKLRGAASYLCESWWTGERVCERACGALCAGVLLSLPDGMEKLRAAVSYLYESWWTGESV